MATRDYMQLMQQDLPMFSFGGEGSDDGQLCRPWGICCDKRGRILVADRSNNRIQIFSPEGNFLMKFGEKGDKSGEFNRPTGIAVNSQNHIVIADKDNHRVQVFDDLGKFIFLFGSNGRQIGMFNYPWDVACNSLDQIAVTDTRNCRIQIFNKLGQFLRKCAFESNLVGKNIYSPRGVVWLSKDCLAVTDFNTHRIAVLQIKEHIIDVGFYGNEGHEPGKFFRPQGICVDSSNNMLITDSRCNRIQVIAPSNMRVMGMIIGRLDRPCDVCIGLNGYVYIVDFGANCVRVY